MGFKTCPNLHHGAHDIYTILADLSQHLFLAFQPHGPVFLGTDAVEDIFAGQNRLAVFVADVYVDSETTP